MSPVELPTIAPTLSPPRAAISSERHGQLVRRARLLAWLGIGWHIAEATIAIAAGLAATSIALIGFGADSLIESMAGLIVVWRFAEIRQDSERAERRAQRLIGASFGLIGVYVAVEAVRALMIGTHPEASWVGIGLAAVTLATMPLLARAKARVGDELHSSATVSEGRQKPPLRLSLGRAAGRAWSQRPARLVVGRSDHRARYRRGRPLRGPRSLAREPLLRRLLT